MAEPISSSPLSGAASFRNEWSALVECASPAHDRQRLAELLRAADWARLLVLAEDHRGVGPLTAPLPGPEEPLVPPGKSPASIFSPCRICSLSSSCTTTARYAIFPVGSPSRFFSRDKFACALMPSKLLLFASKTNWC